MTFTEKLDKLLELQNRLEDAPFELKEDIQIDIYVLEDEIGLYSLNNPLIIPKEELN